MSLAMSSSIWVRNIPFFRAAQAHYFVMRRIKFTRNATALLLNSPLTLNIVFSAFQAPFGSPPPASMPP